MFKLMKVTFSPRENMIACQLSREAWTWCVPSHLALAQNHCLSGEICVKF